MRVCAPAGLRGVKGTGTTASGCGLAWEKGDADLFCFICYIGSLLYRQKSTMVYKTLLMC